MDIQVHPGHLKGRVRIPASKSHTIRALLISSLAEGESVIKNPLHSSDAVSCVEACRLLGASVDTRGDDWVVKGRGNNRSPAENIIDTGNSGTTLYLTASIAALNKGWTFFTGDHQIRKRPAENLLAALRGLGAEAFSSKDNGCAPFAISGPWKGGKISISCPTSQFLSSLLISAPLAEKEVITEIDVPLLYEKPYAEMTLRWLEEQGINLEKKEDLSWFRIPGGQAYKPFRRSVPADWSSATFFLAASCVTGGEIFLEGLDTEDSQGDKAVLDMMRALGAEVEVFQTPDGQTVRIHAAELRGTELDLNATPDALPALAVVGCFAEGETHLVNVPQARLKETDRIAVMARELASLGADISERPDGLVIRKSKLTGGLVNSHQDHRVAMSMALAALGAEGPVTIKDAEAVSVTFPDFFSLLDSLRQS